MPHLMNMSGDPLLARVLAARRRVSQVGIADLGLRERDAGVFEEEVREGHDPRGRVDEGDEEGGQEEEEARAGLHLACFIVVGRRSWACEGAAEMIRGG